MDYPWDSIDPSLIHTNFGLDDPPNYGLDTAGTLTMACHPGESKVPSHLSLADYDHNICQNSTQPDNLVHGEYDYCLKEILNGQCICPDCLNKDTRSSDVASSPPQYHVPEVPEVQSDPGLSQDDSQSPSSNYQELPKMLMPRRGVTKSKNAKTKRKGPGRGSNARQNPKTVMGIVRNELKFDILLASDEKVHTTLLRVQQLVSKDGRSNESFQVNQAEQNERRPQGSDISPIDIKQSTTFPTSKAKHSFSSGTHDDDLSLTPESSSQPFNHDRPRSISLTNHPRETQSNSGIYQCTYPCRNKSFSTVFDWKRHERSKHWNGLRYMCYICLNLDDGVTAPDGRSLMCGFCREAPFSDHEAVKRHNLQCVDARLALSHFPRKDKLQQHFQKTHKIRCRTPRYEQLSLQAKRWVFEGDGHWPKECGFCGDIFNDFDERSTHVEVHFKKGRVISEWKVPFRKKGAGKQRDPHPSWRKDDSSDDSFHDEDSCGSDNDDYFSHGNAQFNHEYAGPSNYNRGLSSHANQQKCSSSYQNCPKSHQHNNNSYQTLLDPDSMLNSFSRLKMTGIDLPSHNSPALSKDTAARLEILYLHQPATSGILSLPKTSSTWNITLPGPSRPLPKKRARRRSLSSIRSDSSSDASSVISKPYQRSISRHSVGSSISNVSILARQQVLVTLPLRIPALNQQLVTTPYDFGYDLPCEFLFQGCHVIFHPQNVEEWIEHSISHFQSLSPPPKSVCIFCDDYQSICKVPESTESRRHAWRDRMLHIHRHLRDLTPSEQSRPDYFLFHYLREQSLIDKELYISLVAYTERPHCDGLLPLGSTVPERSEAKQRSTQELHDLSKEKKTSEHKHDGLQRSVGLCGDNIISKKETPNPEQPQCTPEDPISVDNETLSQICSETDSKDNRSRSKSSDCHSGCSSPSLFSKKGKSLSSSVSTVSSYKKWPRKTSTTTSSCVTPSVEINLPTGSQIATEQETVQTSKSPPTSKTVGMKSARKRLHRDRNVAPVTLHDHRSTSSNISSGSVYAASRTYETAKYRVPDNASMYITSTSRGNVDVMNHKTGRYDAAEPRSSDAKSTQYYSSSSKKYRDSKKS